jgi:hypothetical protein
VFMKHGVWPDEYKVLFGLNLGCGLVGSGTKTKFQEHGKLMFIAGKFRPGSGATPEQLSALNQGRKQSVQARKSYVVAARKRAENLQVGQKVSQARTRSNPIRVCPTCQSPFKRTWERKKYCSAECGREGANNALRHPWLPHTCAKCGKVFQRYFNGNHVRLIP